MLHLTKEQMDAIENRFTLEWFNELTQVCAICDIEKLISEYHKHKGYKKGIRPKCKLCIIKESKQYRENNKEQIAKAKKKCYENNKEYYSEYKKQWHQVNKEERSEKHKQYYKQNKKHIFEMVKKYKTENKEYYSEWHKQYAQTSKGKAVAKAGRQNRRARVKNATGSHTAKDILNLFDLQSGKCVYCNKKLHKTKRNSYHVDHIVPLAKGGSNAVDNLQILCARCNMQKHDKMPEEFAAQFNKLF